MDLDLGHTRLIIDEGRKYGLLRNQLAYVLATAFWETARTMKPVREAFWLSESWRRKNLRYYPWYGRGFVQLTWEANYVKAGQKLGLDLTTDPDKVMEPGVSAKILVRGSAEAWFTKYRLKDFITLQKSDFVGARRIINGTDKAREIAKLAREYDADLKAIGYGGAEQPKEPLTVTKEEAVATGAGGAAIVAGGALWAKWAEFTTWIGGLF